MRRVWDGCGLRPQRIPIRRRRFMQFVYHSTQAKRYRFPTHTNDLIIDRAEAQTSEVFVVRLEPGEAPPLPQHNDTEQIFYILEGEGTLRIGAKQEEHPVRAGDVVRIPPRTLHAIECDSTTPLVYLAVDCFVAGRPLDEPTWDDH